MTSRPIPKTAILSLLANYGRRTQVSRDARRLVEENMSARRAAKVFEEICLSAVHK